MVETLSSGWKVSGVIECMSGKHIMHNHLTVCLMTCGEETEAECLEAVSSWKDNVIFQEVRNVTPAVSALNQMFSQCETDYLIPLDADMVLNRRAYSRIEDALNIASMNKDWHTILFPLWDTLTEEKIYALKVFNMKAMRNIPYKDDPCPDIQHYKDLTAAGLRSFDLYHEPPIGKHVVRGNYFCYAKYRDLYMTARSRPRDLMESHFKGGSSFRQRAWNHYEYFMDQHCSGMGEHYLYCVGGMVEGIKTPLNFKSKDLSDRTMRYADDPVKHFEEWYFKDKTHRIFV